MANQRFSSAVVPIYENYFRPRCRIPLGQGSECRLRNRHGPVTLAQAPCSTALVAQRTRPGCFAASMVLRFLAERIPSGPIDVESQNRNRRAKRIYLLRWLFSADFFNDTAICRSFEAKAPLSRSRALLFWVTWSNHLRVSLAGYRCLLPSVCNSSDQQSHGLLEQHAGGRTDWDAHEHRALGLPTNRAPGARKIESMIVSIKRSCSHGSHKNTHWTLSVCAALRHVCSQHRHTWAHLRKCLWCSA